MTRPRGVIDLDPFWAMEFFDPFILWGSPKQIFDERMLRYHAFNAVADWLDLETFSDPLPLVAEPLPPTIEGRRIAASLRERHLTPGA